ncbi:hypothetical protein BAMA111019_15925 [Bacillus manliponensis]
MFHVQRTPVAEKERDHLNEKRLGASHGTKLFAYG